MSYYPPQVINCIKIIKIRVILHDIGKRKFYLDHIYIISLLLFYPFFPPVFFFSNLNKKILFPHFSFRVTVEHARGLPRRGGYGFGGGGGGGGGGRDRDRDRRPAWLDR